jgi:pilus assembly protein Flp/PilA
MNLMMRLFREEEGQGMTEYAMILGLIAVVVITVVTTMGTSITAKFQSIVDALKPASASGL